MTFNCRFCNQPLSTIFLNLGMSPLSNAYLQENMLDEIEPIYPLCVYICDECLLVQLPEFESPKEIFSDYAYFSSYSKTWLEHSQSYVDMMMDRFDFNKNNLVVEIASNDGYLLQFFKKKNIPILGIEPAKNVAKISEQKGIPTIVQFFGVDTANELVKNNQQANLIIGNNVLAHVPDLNDFVKGMKILLKPEGIITMEFPHLLQLIKNTQFDTIYHEHFSYFSLFIIQKIFSYHGLTIFDVNEIPTHGGSLRIFARHSENNSLDITKRMTDLIELEKRFGLSDLKFYSDFEKKVKILKQNIQKFFNDAQKQNKKIVCYGAAAKGNTLLNYCKINPISIDYVVDLNSYKQGLFLPGTHVHIKKPEEIQKTKPDYVVIIPWNIQDEIIQQMNYIRDWGGQFVILIPEVKVIS